MSAKPFVVKSGTILHLFQLSCDLDCIKGTEMTVAKVLLSRILSSISCWFYSLYFKINITAVCMGRQNQLFNN